MMSWLPQRVPALSYLAVRHHIYAAPDDHRAYYASHDRRKNTFTMTRVFSTVSPGPARIHVPIPAYMVFLRVVSCDRGQRNMHNGQQGVLDRNRTCDFPLRRRALYPSELQGQTRGLKNSLFPLPPHVLDYTTRQDVLLMNPGRRAYRGTGCLSMLHTPAQQAPPTRQA